MTTTDLLRLASSPEVMLAALVKANRDQLKKASVGVGSQAEQEWSKAMAVAIDYVKLVLTNNPGRQDVVYARPDVRYAITSATEAAANLAADRAEATWKLGAQLGARHAVKESALLGPKVKAVIPEPDDNVVKLRDDAVRLGKDAEKFLMDAIMAEDWKKALQAASSRTTLRGRMIAEASVQTGHTTAKTATLEGSGSKKMWVADMSGDPCGHCLKLHGSTVGWDEVFPSEFPGLKPLATWGPLYGPQRHPHCRCVVVPVP